MKDQFMIIIPAIRTRRLVFQSYMYNYWVNYAINKHGLILKEQLAASVSFYYSINIHDLLLKDQQASGESF